MHFRHKLHQHVSKYVLVHLLKYFHLKNKILFKTHQIIHARPAPKLHPRGRVALVEREVQIDAHLDDADQLEEVDRQEVRLGPVGLPELARVEAAEGVDAAGGFVRRDGPGG